MNRLITFPLVRPWNEEWQVWTPVRKKAAFALSLSGPLIGLKIPDGACCAIPARLVTAVPFWVEAAGEALEIALLEVEMRGLVTSDRLASDVSILCLRREEGRALVLAMVYPQEWPATLEALKGVCFAPSPLLAVLSRNTVHLWREADDLVAVVVWQDQVICWETMHWTDDEDEIQTWLECLMIQLEDELKIGEPLLVKEWCGIFDEVPKIFTRDPILSGSDRMEGPAVRTSAPFGHWLPALQRRAREVGRTRARFVRIGVSVCTLVLCCVAVVTFLSFRIQWRIAQAERELDSLNVQIAPLQVVAARWSQVETSVDERFHPLEVLRSIVRALPESGVRLTVFEMSPEKITVEGEADNVSAASDFFRAIENEKEQDGGLIWEMSPPSLQPNSTARFAIFGVRQEP